VLTQLLLVCPDYGFSLRISHLYEFIWGSRQRGAGCL
jgi:hypothetical protein